MVMGQRNYAGRQRKLWPIRTSIRNSRKANELVVIAIVRYAQPLTKYKYIDLPKAFDIDGVGALGHEHGVISCDFV